MSVAVPKLISEIPAVAALVPLAGVTHTAVASGNWSGPATWAGAVVPGIGAKVLISADVVVTFDQANSPNIDWIRVEGTFSVSRTMSTTLNVDTIVTNRDSVLDWGTVENPVPLAYMANIIILEGLDIDPAVDTELMGRGIIALGQTSMHGHDIGDTFEMCSLDPLVGHTSVTLENAPAGWNNGDAIKIGGTRYLCEKWNGTEKVMWPHRSDEDTISSISSNVVNFATPLVYDHSIDDFTEPNTTWDLKTHVMNMSRNVRISSENGAATPRHRRGHVMFMHNPATDIRFVEFFELGRTEKKYKASDASYLPSLNPFEFTPLLTDSNVRGRYALHLHNMGTESLDFDDQAIVIGCSVRGTPGWGYAQHNSNAFMYNCTLDRAQGVGYMAEAQNERGLWKDCIAMDCQSDHGTTSKLESAGFYDLGRSGSGFQFGSRQIRAIGLVAQSCNMGLTFFHRGRGNNSVHGPTGNLLDGVIGFSAWETDLPDMFGYLQTKISTETHPIFHCDNIKAIACAIGVIVEKSSAKQRNDSGTVFSNIEAYQCINASIEFAYTSHYTAKNLKVLGFNDGVAQQSTSNTGLSTQTNSFDVAFVDATVERARHLWDVDNNFTKPDGGMNATMSNRNHQQSNVLYTNITEEYAIVRGNGGWPYPIPDDTTPLPVVTPSITLAGPNTHAEGFNFYHYLPGDFDYDFAKTDSMGTVPQNSNQEGIRYGVDMMVGFIQTLGYWTEANGDKWLMLPVYFRDRGTGETHKTICPTRLGVGLLSGQYSGGTDHGVIDFAAVVAPEDLTTISSVFPPLNGRISDRGNDEYWYYPDPGFDGVEDVVYWLTDRKGYIERHVISFDASTTKFGDYIVLDLAGGLASPVFGAAMSIAIMVQ